MRDDLGAELLATLFDDTEQARAAEVEARLGHLAHALIVPDLDAASNAARARPESLTTLWLVSDGAKIRGEAEATGGLTHGNVVADDGGARRITRIPERPTLGRAAREQRAAEMQQAAENLVHEIEVQRRTVQRIDAAIADAEALLEGIGIWLAGDGDRTTSDAERQGTETAERMETAAQAADDAESAAAQLRPRRRLLRELLLDGALLDAPDRTERVAELR